MTALNITPFKRPPCHPRGYGEGRRKNACLLKYLPRLNHCHFAYVGSVYGSGAWAVAEACALLNYKCTLFVAKSDYTPPWLSELERKGAKLHWHDPLPR